MADFIERRRITDFADPSEALRNAVNAMRERGAIEWMRAHVRDMTQELILEGWRIRPDDQGPLPL